MLSYQGNGQGPAVCTCYLIEECVTEFVDPVCVSVVKETMYDDLGLLRTVYPRSQRPYAGQPIATCIIPQPVSLSSLYIT